jgi:hypothetical protein
MKRVFVALLAVGALSVGLGIPPANAAAPNHQACLGHDISGYAQDGASFGAFVATIARTPNGAGDEIQAHLAGAIPDEVIPNTCN